MAIRIVDADHMPETEVKPAAIFIEGNATPIEAHYHKCEQKGDIHICIHDAHPASALVPKHVDHDDDEDEDHDEHTRTSEVKHAQPAPPTITRESLFHKRLRIVINDGRDSNYNGHFGDDGVFVSTVVGK